MPIERLPARWTQLLTRLERTATGRTQLKPLSQSLYENHFARWTPTANAHLNDPAFVEQLALSTHRAAMWEQGWELIQREGPWSFVHSGFIQLFVRTADEIRSRRARVGQQVEVRMPCLREGLMPGFLYAFARAGGIDPAAAHVRIYLNVQAETAARIFQTLLTAEPFERLRFEMKMPSTRAAFSRCDTMVVYAEPSNAHRLLRQLRALKRTFPRGWRSPTPFAAWEIEPGIALAESPPLAAGAAQSFGQHRSGLVARAVVEGLAFKERTAALWAARLCALLQTEGIDPQRPHRQRLEPAFWDRLIRS